MTTVENHSSEALLYILHILLLVIVLSVCCAYMFINSICFYTNRHGPFFIQCFSSRSITQSAFTIKSQPACQHLIHTHSHTSGAAIGSKLGFSILPKDTSTCRPEESGIEPPTVWLVDVPLYLLGRSRPHKKTGTVNIPYCKEQCCN